MVRSTLYIMRKCLAWLQPDFTMSHQALSVFRFSFFIVTFCEFVQLYRYRNFFFDDHDWVGRAALHLLLAITLGLAVGWKIRYLKFLNYILVLVVLDKVTFHYHIDHVIHCVSFLFLFAPESSTLSVDALQCRASPPPNYVSKWFFVLIFLGTELIYFDSLFHKFRSRLWMEGLAFYYPAAMPHFSTGVFQESFEIPIVMKLASHAALALEVLFPLVLFKRFRPVVVLIGLALHLGIVVFFPIPWFGLLLCALYMIYLPWEKLFAKGSRVVPRADNQREARIGAAISAVLIVSQLLYIVEFSGVDESRSWPGKVRRFLHKRNHDLSNFIGTVPHPVYVDAHFTLQKPLLRFELIGQDGTTLLVPTYTLKGYPEYPETTGRLWVVETFYFRGEGSDLNQVFESWSRFIEKWAERETVNLEDYTISVSYKLALVDFLIDFDANNRIEDAPWNHAGTLTYKAGKGFTANWEAEFESLYPLR